MSASEVLVPVSVGELLDKITILQIKSERIEDQNKQVNIRKELSALLETCRNNSIDVTHVLVRELKSVNEELWVIEDDIREKERAKTFDQKFIELARAVYVTNDKRFQIKSQINKAMGSAYAEEKSYKPY
ncbi:MAG: hypothetical protein FJY29_08320 [Betaproteobacteria bacterium]|nr:hypothetical protein [Betaproteobacteria bacterium]